jgi:tetratricopeptide (TPR) repeat protein
MPVTHTELPSLSHAVFLQRAAHASPASARGLQARLAQGAFLALRLIDLLDPERQPVHPDAFRYQCVATERFFRNLRAASTEGAHLQALVVSAGSAERDADASLLWPGLFAYAHYLENELRLEEALDVLGTLRQVGAGRLTVADAVALSLRAGRVNRKLSRFDEAEEAYLEAGRVALSAGDQHSELLSRVGRAHAMLGRGNLPEAERCLTNALADARRTREREAEALGEHVLAAVLQHRGSPDIALGHAWRAFELYEDEDSCLRALGDVGLILLMLGNVRGAEHALTEVVRRGASRDLVANALIELMHCASSRGDQVTFARWRGRCEERKGDMPPNILADYHTKSGIGEARFGLFRRSRASLTRALKVAEEAGLHESVFKIGRIKNGLSNCEEALTASPFAEAEPVIESEAVREVLASLAQVAAEQL